MDTKARYVTVKSYPGIRKEIKTGKLVVTKSINGQRFSKSFNSIREAQSWKNSFHPGATKETTVITTSVSVKINGELSERTFGDVWNLYYQQHVLGLETSSQEAYAALATIFDNVRDIPIHKFTRDFINRFVAEKKELAIILNSKRCNFDRPLKFLKAMLRWYSENYDETFLNPIVRRHLIMGKIKEPIKREKKLSTNELIAFFEALPAFYRDLAMVQFYTAARIQEVAGLQVSSVDISKRTLLIKDVVVWNRSKKFVELKTHTKNGETRLCHLTDLLVDILNRKISEPSVKCSYVFNENGKPLSYRKIQHAYNFALKKCGLGDRFSGSHILRHSMATITRLVTGSLEATQAITGHKDQKLVQHYASMPAQAQKDAVQSVDEHFKSLTRASRCEQNE